MPHPGGRPSTYSPEIAQIICSQLTEPSKGLYEICKQDGFPPPSTVYQWLAAHPEFADMYAKAREAKADRLFEETLAIADDGRNDWMAQQSEEEQAAYKANGEHIQRSRLRVDTRKWAASRLAPKKYGERTVHEHTGADGGPMQLEVTVAASGLSQAFGEVIEHEPQPKTAVSLAFDEPKGGE